MERFNLGELKELEVWKQCQIKVSNRFVAWENLSDREGIKRAWENTKENIKISSKESLGLYELKQHKSWFDEKFYVFRSKEAG